MRGSRLAGARVAKALCAIAVGCLAASGCAVGVVGDPDPGVGPADGSAVPTVTVPATGTVPPAEGGVDASVKDTSTPPADVSAPPDTSPPPDAGGCTGKLVINEVQTEGTAANQEFVEIYNPTACDVVLEGWALKYSAASGNTPSTFFTGLISHKVLAKDTFVVANTSFSGPKNATYTNGTLAADNGQVGLFDKLGKKVDGVGYGTIATADRTLTEGNPAPTPGGAGKSVQRVPNGTDTDSNQADFRSANSTPNAPN